jgi:hypothetical protein
MVRRKGEMTDAQIDREWPHQVALAGELVKGRAYTVIREFCRSENLSLCPRGHSFRGEDDWYICFCFAKQEHAMRFQQRFGGELMDPHGGRGGRARRHHAGTSPWKHASVTAAA